MDITVSVFTLEKMDPAKKVMTLNMIDYSGITHIIVNTLELLI